METKKCPFCGEEILAIAKKCKHCGEWLKNAIIAEQKKMVECPFCAEEIEDGLKICPLCDEPLNRQTKSPIGSSQKEKPKRKKSKLLTTLGIIIGVVGLGTYICIEMGVSFDDIVGATEDVVDAIEGVVDSAEQPRNVSMYEYNGVKISQKAKTNLDGSFPDFLKNFTKNKETQINLISKPFRYSGLNEDYETYLENWNEESIKENWSFWDGKYFIEGIKKIDGQEFIGTWYEKNDIIIYEFGIPESGYIQIFIFEKINNKWFLYEFRNWAM